MWSLRVLLKYGALQLVGWIVVIALGVYAVRDFGWPRHFVWMGVALWIAKDIALYPLVWRSLEQSPARAPYEGEVAITLSALDPAGEIRVRGERWKARLRDDAAARVEEGMRVRVVGRDGLTLIVIAAK